VFTFAKMPTTATVVLLTLDIATAKGNSCICCHIAQESPIDATGIFVVYCVYIGKCLLVKMLMIATVALLTLPSLGKSFL
jgi:hypothetical protein